MNPIVFGETRNLQKYEDSNGSITHLQSNRIKQLIGLINYMIQLNVRRGLQIKGTIHFNFILDEQWSNLTAHEMRSSLVNAVLENHRYQAAPGTSMSLVTSYSSSTSKRSPIHLELASFKKGIKREVSAYSTLKDEQYFDKFQRVTEV